MVVRHGTIVVVTTMTKRKSFEKIIHNIGIGMG
jgi:hypothetical protein